MSKSLESIAEQLVDYMNYRARKEGLAHELTKSFYLDSLRRGAAQLFGIRWNKDGIAEDVQNPDALREWKAKKTSL